jgi:hypothetical protein
MNEDLIHAIGFWTIRLALVAAAIYFLTKGNPDYAMGCAVGVGFTFLFD